MLARTDGLLELLERFAACLKDERHQSYVDQSYLDMLRHRVFQIAQGYEDVNDSDSMRSDPMFKLAAGRDVNDDDLASQPTICQFRQCLHSAAYVLMHTLREKFLQGTSLASATMGTIRLKLLKVAVRVESGKTFTRLQIRLPVGRSICTGDLISFGRPPTEMGVRTRTGLDGARKTCNSRPRTAAIPKPRVIV